LYLAYFFTCFWLEGKTGITCILFEFRVAIINAKYQIRQRRYQPNLTFGGYDYWRLWILAGTVLAVLKFGVRGCHPKF